jgi:hypothetical protein
MLAFSAPAMEFWDWKQKSHPFGVAFLRVDCLTMSYFHERLLTIIGAAAFHGPVRDGKEWFHRAMVIRHDLLLCRVHGGARQGQFGRRDRLSLV